VGLSRLAPAEREIVFCCLRAAANGPFFDDDEFHSLFGLDRDELRAIVARGPDISDTDADVSLAINNSFANLLGYPHYEGKALSEMVGVGDDEIQRVFSKWRGGSGLTNG
jgi:hypothetical protein